VALGAAYGKRSSTTGPCTSRTKSEDAKVRGPVHAHRPGLAFKNGEKLQGFAVAGEDQSFPMGRRDDDGETVVLTDEKIPSRRLCATPGRNARAWANNLSTKMDCPRFPSARFVVNDGCITAETRENAENRKESRTGIPACQAVERNVLPYSASSAPSAVHTPSEVAARYVRGSRSRGFAFSAFAVMAIDDRASGE